MIATLDADRYDDGMERMNSAAAQLRLFTILLRNETEQPSYELIAEALYGTALLLEESDRLLATETVTPPKLAAVA